ncbi:hypothetical protein [Paraburkholderia tropica]|uniref:hypothetical protein n=1 Tax=Paraburkholderia tropica TaxID=92647 RepID=UPI002AB6D371|nr:hypothetical protein [Paraburkholderia tropica]
MIVRVGRINEEVEGQRARIAEARKGRLLVVAQRRGVDLGGSVLVDLVRDDAHIRVGVENPRRARSAEIA